MLHNIQRLCVLPFVLLLLLVSCKTSKQSEQDEEQTIFDYHDNTSIRFIKQDSLSNVLNFASQEKKILTFVEFYTDWCLPCQIMDETVFVNQTLGDYYNVNFINYKVNAEKLEGPDLRFIFQVTEYPTFLFLDSNGRIILKDSGSKSIAHMMLLGETAIKEYTRIKNQADNLSGE